MTWSMIDTLGFHFTIGLGFGIFYVMQCMKRQKVRRHFTFGGDQPFSWGDSRQWIRWWSAAYIFEVLTSFLFGRHIYFELAASLLEAAALTIGLFIVDRIALAIEDQPTLDTPLRMSLREKLRRGKDKRAENDAARQRAIREAFDQATRNK